MGNYVRWLEFALLIRITFPVSLTLVVVQFLYRCLHSPADLGAGVQAAGGSGSEPGRA